MLSGGLVVQPADHYSTMNVSMNMSVDGVSPPQHPLALLLLTIPMLTIFGNALVIAAVCREKSLRTVTNLLLVSLALADLLVATFVMSFAVYFEVKQFVWGLGRPLCNIYMAADVCCSTASILNLLAISLDRYIAISHPISYARYEGNGSRAYISISIVWFVSIAVATPIFFDINDSIDDEKCEFTNAYFILFSSLLSFFIPCIAMMCLYGVIFKRLRERQRARSTRKHRTPKPQPPICIANTNNERIGSALLGGARIVREMGRRFRNVVENSHQTSVTHHHHHHHHRHHHQRQQREHGTTATVDTSSLPTLTLTSSSDNQTMVPAAEVVEVVTVGGDELIKSSTSSSSVVAFLSKSIDACRPFGTHLSEWLPFIDSTSRDNSLRAKSVPTLFAATTTASSSSSICPTSSTIINDAVYRKSSVSLLATTPNHSLVRRRHVPDETIPVSKHFELKPLPSIAVDKIDESNNNITIINNNTTTMVDWSSLTATDATVVGQQRGDRRSAVAGVWKSITDWFGLYTGKTVRDDRTIGDDTTTNRHYFTKRVQRQLRKEQKATVTLAIVLAIFLICWVPFFALHLTNAVCMLVHGDGCVHFIGFFLTTWLGYLNSTMNPLIYTIFNLEFRRAFKRFLYDYTKCCCCCCKDTIQRTSASSKRRLH